MDQGLRPGTTELAAAFKREEERIRLPCGRAYPIFGQLSRLAAPAPEFGRSAGATNLPAALETCPQFLRGIAVAGAHRGGETNAHQKIIGEQHIDELAVAGWPVDRDVSIAIVRARLVGKGESVLWIYGSV